MNSTILIACSLSLIANAWANKLQKAHYLTTTCYTNLSDALCLVDGTFPNLLLAEATFDKEQGLELARQAAMTHPAIRCALFIPPSSDVWTRALQLDVSGYLPERVNEVEVLHCLSEIRQGQRYISSAFRTMALLPSAEMLAFIKGLSDRQKQILKLLAEGLTSRQIALEIGLTESGVNSQKEHLWHKLGLKGANELKSLAGSVQGYL